MGIVEMTAGVWVASMMYRSVIFLKNYYFTEEKLLVAEKDDNDLGRQLCKRSAVPVREYDNTFDSIAARRDVLKELKIVLASKCKET